MNLDGDVYIFRAGDPATEISGRLPFSRMTEIGLDGRAVVPTHVLLFPGKPFSRAFPANAGLNRKTRLDYERPRARNN